MTLSIEKNGAVCYNQYSMAQEKSQVLSLLYTHIPLLQEVTDMSIYDTHYDLLVAGGGFAGFAAAVAAAERGLSV